jgi:DNA (cytosine-5)-methyltransferase 1
MGNPNGSQLAEHPEQSAREERQATSGASGACDGMAYGESERCEEAGPSGGRQAERSGIGCWSDFLLIPCRDNKVRRISSQPGDVPLAYGLPRDVGRVFPGLAGMVKAARRNRVGRLKGYGNAIVPQVAAEFIKACGEIDG